MEETVTISLVRFNALIEAEKQLTLKSDDIEKKVKEKFQAETEKLRLKYAKAIETKTNQQVELQRKEIQLDKIIRRQYEAKHKAFIDKHKRDMAVLNDYRKVFRKHYPDGLNPALKISHV